MVNWYYVEGSDRVGPVSFEHLQSLFHSHQIDVETYVWRKGFANWERIKNVEELDFNPITNGMNVNENLLNTESEEDTESTEDENDNLDEDYSEIEEANSSIDFIEPFSWTHLNRDEERFFVKIGHDRAKSGPVVYGPFSVNQILESIAQKRMNEKTLVFTQGLDNWLAISSIPFFKDELGLVALSMPINTRDPHYFACIIDEKVEIFLVKEMTYQSAIVLSACDLENAEINVSFFIGMKLVEQNVKIQVHSKNDFSSSVRISFENVSPEMKIKIDEFNK